MYALLSLWKLANTLPKIYYNLYKILKCIVIIALALSLSLTVLELCQVMVRSTKGLRRLRVLSAREWLQANPRRKEPGFVLMVGLCWQE